MRSLPLVAGTAAGRRVLDLRDGVLAWSAEAPPRTLTTARFACVARPGVAVMTAEIDAALCSPALSAPSLRPG